MIFVYHYILPYISYTGDFFLFFRMKWKTYKTPIFYPAFFVCVLCMCVHLCLSVFVDKVSNDCFPKRCKTLKFYLFNHNLIILLKIDQAFFLTCYKTIITISNYYYNIHLYYYIILRNCNTVPKIQDITYN